MTSIFNSEKIHELLKNSSLEAYTDLVCISIFKNINSIKYFKKIIERLQNKEDIMVSSMGNKTITIILHEKLLNLVKQIFGKEIQDINNKVGAIFIKYPKEVSNTPGITTYISSLFANKNISIYELISNYNDDIIIIGEKETYKMATYLKKIFLEEDNTKSISQVIKKFLREQKVKSVLKTSEIGTVTNLVFFHIKRNIDSLKLYDELKKNFIKSSNYILGVVGERYISLVVNEQFYDKILNFFEKYLISIQKNVAVMLIDCSKTDKVAGVITYITALLAKKNINMYSFFTSQDDIILIINEDKAFEYVENLKKSLKA